MNNATEHINQKKHGRAICPAKPSFKRNGLYYLVLLLILLLSACSATFAAGLTEQDAYAIFRQGNDLFRQANSADDAETAKELYDKAILRYQSLVTENNIVNAGLYYNLGNAYLLKGDVGRAILNYRRAEQIDDSNPDIKRNLAFARSRRVDKVAVNTEKKVLQTLFFWHYDIPMKVRFLLACSFFGLLFVMLTVCVWTGKKPGLRAGSFVFGLLFVSFALSVAIERTHEKPGTSGVVISESIVARSGDGYNYQPNFKEPLHAGTEFKLVKTQSGWFNIRLADGSEGWIPSDSAEKI